VSRTFGDNAPVEDLFAAVMDCSCRPGRSQLPRGFSA
jgi:hypothetical protein